MRVAVTGAAGFVGSNLVRRLLNEGAEVVAFVRPGGDYSRIEGLRLLSVEEVDICDSKRMAAAISKYRPETIYHLASTGWTTEASPEEHWKVIFEGMESLLEAAQSAPPTRLISTGSVAEYGTGGQSTEDDDGEPETVLGTAKRAAFGIASNATAQLDIQFTWLRLFTPYGPWESPARLVPSAIRSALTGGSLVMRSPNERRDFIAVDDVVDAMMLAKHSSLPQTAVINVCRGEATRVADIVSLILSLTGGAPKIQVAASADTGKAVAQPSGSNARAESWLGWKPKTSLEDGIGQAISWWRERIE